MLFISVRDCLLQISFEKMREIQTSHFWRRLDWLDSDVHEKDWQ